MGTGKKMAMPGGGRQARGFTLIELMVTIAVAAVLLALAQPSFTALINSNRLAAQSNELVAGLQEARIEALRANRRVTVCRSSNGTTCDAAAGNWTGWISFVDTDGDQVVDDGETLLRSSRVKVPLQVSSTNRALTFRADGMARTNNAARTLVDNTFIVCIPTTRPVNNKRQVALNAGSRIALTVPAGNGACP